MEELLQLSSLLRCLCSIVHHFLTQVTLARGPSGYGFSVHSSHPVYITAVDEGNTNIMLVLILQCYAVKV